jgi:hypothetical protein
LPVPIEVRLAQLGKILENEHLKKPWLTFQRALLQSIATEVRRNGTAKQQYTANLTQAVHQPDPSTLNEQRFERHVEPPLDELMQMRTRVDRVHRVVDKIHEMQRRHTALLNDIRDATCRQADPPLYVPTAAPKCEPGLQALRFSERPIRHMIGFEAELRKLMLFISDSEQFRWWGVVGEGGTGKSRLALELVEQLLREGWSAGFLRSRGKNFPDWLAGEHAWEWTPEAPTLLVIDCVAERAGQLLRWFTSLHERRSRLLHPVRVLLLDRPGVFGPVFSDRLSMPGETRDEYLIAAKAALYRPPLPEAEPAKAELASLRYVSQYPVVQDTDFLEIHPLPRVLWRVFLETALGTRLALPADREPFWQDVARISDDGKPLLLHAIAEALESMVDASGELGLDRLNRDHLLDEMLERERHTSWRSAAGVSDRETWQHKLPQYESAIALVTLTRGLPLRLARAPLTEIAELGPPKQNDALPCNGLEAILNQDGTPPDGRLRPLEPDLFGEYLLVSGAQPNERGERRLDVDVIAKWAVELDASACGQTMLMASRDYPEELMPWILAILRCLPADACAEESTDAAWASPFPSLCLAIGNLLRSEDDHGT